MICFIQHAFNRKLFYKWVRWYNFLVVRKYVWLYSILISKNLYISSKFNFDLIWYSNVILVYIIRFIHVWIYLVILVSFSWMGYSHAGSKESYQSNADGKSRQENSLRWSSQASMDLRKLNWLYRNWINLSKIEIRFSRV